MKLDDRRRPLLGESIKSAPGADAEFRSTVMELLAQKRRKGGPS
jgi:hypothetical protein